MWKYVAAALGIASLIGGGATVVKVAATAKARSKLTNAPANADGIVTQDPVTLANQAGVSLTLYALARAIASEAGGSNAAAQTAVAWVIVNYARRAKRSVESVILGGKGAGDGKFGSQEWGKFVASSRDPSAVQVDIARAVLSGVTPDPTAGAMQFDSPGAQRALQKRKPGKYKSPEEVAAARIKAGNVMVLIPGVPEDEFRFWRPVRAGERVA